MDATLSLITPEAQAIAMEAESTLGVIQAVRISSPEECQAAVDQTRDIKIKAKKLEDLRFSMTRPLDDAKKAIMDFFRGPAEVLAKCETLLKGSIGAYQQEQQRIAAAADAERRRLERIELERQAEEQRNAEALLQQAEDAELAGDTEAAQAFEAQAVAVQEIAAPIAVYVPPPAEKPSGASMRKVWKCRIVTPALVPEQYKMINEKALDAYAKAMKQNAKLEGCEFYFEESVAIR